MLVNKIKQNQNSSTDLLTICLQMPSNINLHRKNHLHASSHTITSTLNDFLLEQEAHLVENLSTIVYYPTKANQTNWYAYNVTWNEYFTCNNIKSKMLIIKARCLSDVKPSNQCAKHICQRRVYYFQSDL